MHVSSAHVSKRYQIQTVVFITRASAAANSEKHEIRFYRLDSFIGSVQSLCNSHAESFMKKMDMNIMCVIPSMCIFTWA